MKAREALLNACKEKRAIPLYFDYAGLRKFGIMTKVTNVRMMNLVCLGPSDFTDNGVLRFFDVSYYLKTF